jgi:hypothetical protein
MNYTAGIVLDKLCGFLLEAGHNVCCFSVVAKGLLPEIPADKIERMAFKCIEKPRENYGLKFKGKIGKIISLFGNNYEAYLHLPKIIKSVVAFAKANKTEMIWNVVQGQTMIKTVRPLAKKALLPYIIQIWDPPTWWLMENGFDKFTKRSILNEFGAAIKNSECCITASEAMNNEYIKRYAPRCAIPVILGFDSSRVLPNAMNPNNFVIALSGQIYAKQEFLSLVAALNLLEWKHNGKHIALRLYGRYYNVFNNIIFSSSANIILQGWLSQDELLPELAAANLLYCPYWFDESFREEASLSFPSKLSTYLKVGKPVLFHGPDYSSPGIFLKKYNAGYICTSLDPQVLAELIKTIIIDPNRDNISDNGFNAFKEYLTLDSMKTNFLKALNINQEK